MLAIKSGDKGAKVNGLRPEALLGVMIVHTLFMEHGVDCVITEGTGGKHGEASLHYLGLAFDVRTWAFKGKKSMLNKVVKELKTRLGDQYDVVLHKTHLHIEYQPK